METLNDQYQATSTAGFEFARRLRNPEFRKLLKDSGWVSGQHIVMALDGERVVDVISRMILHETDHRAFIAIPDQRETHGFVILLVEKARSLARVFKRTPKIMLGPDASIGMLADALEPCGTYVPHSWTEKLLFEKASS